MTCRSTHLSIIGLALGLAAPALAANDGDHTPLEYHPTQLFKFETANQLPAGGIAVTLGTTQSDPSAGSGTGNQVYYGGVAYAPTDRLSFGLDLQYYEDPVIKPINGLFPTIGMDSVAGSVKYQIYNSGSFNASVQGSVELFRFESALTGTLTGNAKQTIGSLQLPLTYEFSPQLQFHVTPGVSIFPENINGNAFYGTVGYIGVGASYKPHDRIALYGAVNAPVAGGNTISNTATITKVPVWTVGGRFNVTPKVALDLYATNGIGTTPATSILTFWPDGDTALFGARLSWTPGQAAKHRPSYRSLRSPLSARELRLQQDGLTLGSADTFEPGTAAPIAWYGSAENAGVGMALTVEQDLQFEGYIEDYADDGSVAASRIPGKATRYMLGGKLRFLDQNNGDPFSAALRVFGGREIGTGTPGPGAIYVDVTTSYKASPKLTLTASPRAAAFGNTETYGLGLGANYELFEGLDVIGEVTQMANGEPTVWAAGARYAVPNTSLNVDLSASNAIGRYGIGTLVGQDDVKYSIGVSTQFNLNSLRR